MIRFENVGLRYGLGPDTRMIVAVAVLAGQPDDADAPDAASAALARAGLHEASTLVVVRQSEIDKNSWGASEWGASAWAAPDSARSSQARRRIPIS